MNEENIRHLRAVKIKSTRFTEKARLLFKKKRSKNGSIKIGANFFQLRLKRCCILFQIAMY